MWGKKSSIKSAKNRFLYSHKYREQKIGGKNGRNNFSSNTRIVRAKKVGRKIVGESAKKRFYIHTNIVTIKWRKKRRESIFPETLE